VSAIVGLYRLDTRPVDREHVQGMVERLGHRGPDGSGVWTDGSVGFGHRMLWTTPESLQERLPFYDPSRGLAITADARLDNREELMATLDVADRAIPDSSLILLAYDRWGEACSERLLGDFAFVLWDARRGVLFSARDHLGVKPFFYYHQPGRLFACASEIKALFCLPEIPRRLNELRVADYLLANLEDKTITFYRDIVRLPPGHRMIVDGGRIFIQSYWALDPERTLKPQTDEEYAQAFREIFIDAVRVRMRAAFPAGTLLSGGLDSSSITCVARLLAKESHAGPLPTFSAIFDETPSCDERPFIQAVLDQNGLGEIEAHLVRADLLSPMTDLDAMFWHEDGPFFGPNLYMHWGLYGAARRHGVRVLLDGLEGDVTVSHGEDRLTELTRSWQWGTLARELFAIARHGGRGWRRALRHCVVGPIIPHPIRRVVRILKGGGLDGMGAGSILRQDFSRRLGLADRQRAMANARGNWSHTNREDHYRRLNHGVIPLIHEVADMAAAPFCIEPRYPFADRRLVEFCLALPPAQKRCQGWGRIVLRRAMAGVLPEAIRWRREKSNLSGNFNSRLLAGDHSLLEEILIRFPDTIAPYVKLETLGQIHERFCAEPNSPNAMTVWKAASLGLWLRRSGVHV